MLERCLFQNDCLAVRLVGIPRRYDVGPSLMCRFEMLVVTYGEVTIEREGERLIVEEGGRYMLPESGTLSLYTIHGADLLLYELLG